MRQCNTAEELVHLAYDHLDTISPRGIAAFWAALPKLLHRRDGKSRDQFNEQLAEILCNTLENMKRYSHIDISTIAISLAKVMKQVEFHGQRSATGSLHQNLHNLLVGINLDNKHYIFSKIAVHATPILSKFDARSLSNLIFSFGLAEYSPMDESGCTIMDVVALEVMPKLQHFNSQDLSNMLWSYAKLESSNSLLFKAAGNSIVGMNDLSEFWPQALSNIVWAYATAGKSHSKLFSKFGDHIVAMKDLGQFKPQDFSNILWSFSTAGESHPKLFSKLGNHIVAMKDLSIFISQALSNIIWAYATAGKAHPKLFSKLGDHIVALKDLSIFIPQDFSNIAWAYATTLQSHPFLFKKLAHLAISRRNDFKPQELSNLLCAYATVAIIDKHLFTSFAPAVKSILGKCNSQSIANIAWAYAVANVNDLVLFNTDFVTALQAKAHDFGMEECRQLHQWQLWQVELKSGINLPPALREECRQAFVSQLYQLSRLQDDVISVLPSIGLRPKEEVLTPSGYRLDALVKVNGEKVGIEVDGPYHFMNQEPTGSTLLKRRQVSTLDGIRIVSVPYWEWDKFGLEDHTKKQQYLRSKLGLYQV
jgi:hypothetical protein